MAKQIMTPEEYMNDLVHPHKQLMQLIRSTIKSIHPEIKEQIKWNAPSYRTSEDFLTFNHRDTKQVHLVFHHKTCVNIYSPLLVGEYKDRRMMYFKDESDFQEKLDEFKRIIRESVVRIAASD